MENLSRTFRTTSTSCARRNSNDSCSKTVRLVIVGTGSWRAHGLLLTSSEPTNGPVPHVATVVRTKSNLRPKQVRAFVRGGDGSVIAVIAGLALSGGILALAIVRGKDQMQRIEHICTMHRDGFWM